MSDFELMALELQRQAAAALNAELFKKGGLRQASPRRVKRIIAEALSRFVADNLKVSIDPQTKRIDVYWPPREGADVAIDESVKEGAN